MIDEPLLEELVMLMKRERPTLSDSELQTKARQLIEMYRILMFKPPRARPLEDPPNQ